MTCSVCGNENVVSKLEAWKTAEEAGTVKEPTDETAWLIENGRQEWWDGRAAGSKAYFTKDHSEAMRFARFEDAERARCWLLEPIAAHLRSTEHVWMRDD